MPCSHDHGRNIWVLVQSTATAGSPATPGRTYGSWAVLLWHSTCDCRDRRNRGGHMSDERIHHITLNLAHDYQFVAEFDDVPNASPITFDEPEPLGGGRGPNAA